MNKTVYPALIIGAGASGLFAGSILGRKALILEKNEIPGKKLLLTGGGRCNITHASSVPELLEHYNGNRNIIKKILYSLPPERIIRYFSSLGIECREEDGGKVFPANGDAHAIADALSSRCLIKYSETVNKVSYENGIFTAESTGGVFYGRNLLIAAGCSAYPATGSDGEALALIRALGHETVPFTPAMAPLELKRKLTEAEGITLDVTIRKERHESSGSAVVTRKGLSGPAAQNISYMLEKEAEIEIGFCSLTKEELRSKPGKMLVKNAIPLPDRLLTAVLGQLASKRIGDLTKQDADFIISSVTAFRTGAKAIREGAMTDYGGALLSGFNPSRMESKTVRGLYAAGDILEPSADCGGYSLTFAFATAYTAAHSILESLE